MFLYIFMDASHLFVKALENEGVEYIFGIPGEENLPLLEAIRTSSIRFILTRHEQVAGFMAATYGRLTGRAGVCLSTLGPGATNLVTSAAYGLLGGMPMVIITGQKPIKENKQGHFQVVNVVELMRPITKYATQIVSGNKVPDMVREAFRVAQEERPGPVHLEFPEDISMEQADASLLAVTRPRRPIAGEQAIAQAVEMIAKSQKPLILVGAAANRQHISTTLDAFINATGIPFFNTQMGKGVVDERHPLFLGTAALSSGDYLHQIIDDADLIINIGHDVVEKPPFLMRNADKRRVIHINFLSAQVDSIYFPQLEVIGDIRNILLCLQRAVKRQDSWNFENFNRNKDELERHIQEKQDDKGFPLLPQRIVSDVRKAMPADGIVVLDNGMYKIWFARNYKAYKENTLLLDNALGTMGAGLSSAMAAKLLHLEKKVLAVVGDGGFMMNSQELETAVRLGLSLVVLVINDGAYGMIKWKQRAMNLKSFGLDYGNPDFVKYAESYGAHGYRIESAEELLPLLTDCLQKEGIYLIDVPVDYSENYTVLVKELKEKVNLENER